MLTGSEPAGLRVARLRACPSSLARRRRTVPPLRPVTAPVRPLSGPAGASGAGPPWPGRCACLQASCVRALPGGLVDVSSADDDLTGRFP